jgi:S1-C subfamily serine protease
MGIGFDIPASTARSVMEAIVRDGQVTRGWIGVEPQELSAELAESFGIPAGSGVIITGVLQNGPAAQAGIRPGDVITRVAGREVGTVAQLLSAVAALPPGTSAAVDVVRRDGKTQLNVTPARRNPVPRQEQR